MIRNALNRRCLLRGAPYFVLAASGCSRGPTYEIMGSLFPAWLVCIFLGVLLAVVVRWLLLRAHIALPYPVLVYPCLGAVFTFSIWLVFF